MSNISAIKPGGDVKSRLVTDAAKTTQDPANRKIDLMDRRELPEKVI